MSLRTPDETPKKYSAAHRIFNSLLGVSFGDETLRLMLDILVPFPYFEHYCVSLPPVSLTGNCASFVI